MLPRNVTTTRPGLEQGLLAILDFRLEFVNLAAARWAGLEREALIGLITGELLPEFRASGYFDALREVVETGRPYSARAPRLPTPWPAAPGSAASTTSARSVSATVT